MKKASAIVISAVATLSLLGGMLGIVHRVATPPAAQTVYVQTTPAAQTAPAAPSYEGERGED